MGMAVTCSFNVFLFVYYISFQAWNYRFFYWRKLFNETSEFDSKYTPLPENRSGGFNWGEEQAQNNQTGNDE